MFQLHTTKNPHAKHSRILHRDSAYFIRNKILFVSSQFLSLLFFVYYVLRINLFPHNGHEISILPLPLGTLILRPQPLQR